MTARRTGLVIWTFTLLLVTGIGSAPGVLAPLARAAETYKTQPAGDALRPDEVASLEIVSKAFRRVAKLARPGVVRIDVSGGKVQEISPELKERLRRRLGEDLTDEQLQDLARRLNPPGSGSGVIFDADGHIVTNSHVVNSRDEISVSLADDRKYPAKVVGVDTKTDVAVIKIDAPDLQPLKFADSDKAEVGDWVVAVGAPFGLSQTVTHGIISATQRKDVTGIDIYYQNFIQTDAAINPGNSGGPLLNLRGEVLGINTAIASNDERNAGVAFTIPSNMVVKVARVLVAKGVVARGWLGVSYAGAGITAEDVDILELPHNHGVLVDKILAESPAQAAGLQVDDYIIAVNSREFASPQEFAGIIADIEPQQQIKLRFLRDREPQEVSVQLATQPDNLRSRAVIEGATAGRPVPALGLEARALRPGLLEPMRFESDDRGVLVTRLEDGSPNGSTLKAGEVITAVNDHKVRNLAELQAALKSADQQRVRIDVLQQDGDQRLEKIELKK